MRIGFYGNTNNYPLILALAMRRQGHEVVFTLSSNTMLDRPENRYPELAPPYPHWIRDFAPMWKTYFPTPWRRRCVELLRQCDFVVLNQIGPSLARAIGRPAIALLTGSDLQYFASNATVRGVLRETHREPAWFAIPMKLATFPSLIRRQRRGIAEAKLVTHFARGLVPEGDRLLDELGVPDTRRMMLLMTESDRIPFAAPPANKTIRVFCATRLNWKRPVPPGFVEMDFKGSDVMIRGIGLFLRQSGTRLDVRLVRKGLHVNETMDLVKEEGFFDQVTWLDEMSQEAVFEEYRRADILFEQLDRSHLGMAGLDGMATGRPLIANGHPEIALTSAPSPICQARSPEEVARQLARLVPDAEERARVGSASRKYVEKHYSAESAAKWCVDRMIPHLGSTA